MKLTREFTLKEGNYTNDHKCVDLIDVQTGDVVASKMKVEYAKAIIRAVNEHIEQYLEK